MEIPSSRVYKGAGGPGGGRAPARQVHAQLNGSMPKPGTEQQQPPPPPKADRPSNGGSGGTWRPAAVPPPPRLEPSNPPTEVDAVLPVAPLSPPVQPEPQPQAQPGNQTEDAGHSPSVTAAVEPEPPAALGAAREDQAVADQRGPSPAPAADPAGSSEGGATEPMEPARPSFKDIALSRLARHSLGAPAHHPKVAQRAPGLSDHTAHHPAPAAATAAEPAAQQPQHGSPRKAQQRAPRRSASEAPVSPPGSVVGAEVAGSEGSSTSGHQPQQGGKGRKGAKGGKGGSQQPAAEDAAAKPAAAPAEAPSFHLVEDEFPALGGGASKHK